jgi:hypothetical protein
MRFIGRDENDLLLYLTGVVIVIELRKFHDVNAGSIGYCMSNKVIYDILRGSMYHNLATAYFKMHKDIDIE